MSIPHVINRTVMGKASVIKEGEAEVGQCWGSGKQKRFIWTWMVENRCWYTDAVLGSSGVCLQTVAEGRHASCVETFVVYDH